MLKKTKMQPSVDKFQSKNGGYVGKIVVSLSHEF